MSVPRGGPAAGIGDRTAAEAAAMRLALELAGQGVRGANPLVGAVVLAPDGTVLGTGRHRGAGTDHAEVAALADARERGNASVEGATMVVTLEPCNHQGRTGPCSAAILNAGVARVVYAAPDRTSEAAGGARWLADHGVQCDGGLFEAESEHLNARWMLAVAEGRPFVTLKTAQSLDGRVAAADGTSQWITGPEARQDGHSIRVRADAVLAGTGTVLADNPRLTARPAGDDGGSDPLQRAKQPRRAVMGLRAVPEDAAVRGPGFVHLQTRDVHEALAQLAAVGVRHVLVEGGPRIAGAFVSAGVVDELVSYLAPVLLGEGTPMLPPIGVATLAQANRWQSDPAGGPAVLQLGSDVRLRLRPSGSAPPGTTGTEGRSARNNPQNLDAPGHAAHTPQFSQE